MPQRKLGGGAEARQRIPEPVRHARRHLPHRGELLLLHQLCLRRLELADLRRKLRIDVHQLGAGLAEVAGHLLETAGQVADLVARARA